MTDYQYRRLREITNARATELGHRLTDFYGVAYWRSAICLDCGMRASMYTGPDTTRVVGMALELRCQATLAGRCSVPTCTNDATLDYVPDMARSARVRVCPSCAVRMSRLLSARNVAIAEFAADDDPRLAGLRGLRGAA